MEAKGAKQEDFSSVIVRKIAIEKIKSINSKDLKTVVQIIQILDLSRIRTLKKLSEIIKDAAPEVIEELGGEISKNQF